MDLLTQQQTAEVTRLSGRTLERHRWAGTGPKFVRLGRRVFYRRADLEAWIAECTCRSTSEADRAAARTGDMPAARDELRVIGSLKGPEPHNSRGAPTGTPLADQASPFDFGGNNARRKIEKFPAPADGELPPVLTGAGEEGL
jgi:predicted DNA-binding transcriptional regulator AlpA